MIPKSVSPDRIRDNLKATEVRLDTGDLQRLGTLDRNLRFFTFSWAVKAGTHDEELWNTSSDKAFVVQK